MKDKLYGALSLCKKAGKLKTGFDAVCEAAFQQQAKLALVAQDISQGTRKRVAFACEGNCPLLTLPYTIQQLSVITHKPAGVLAVMDEHFAALCLSQLPKEEEPA